MLGLAGLVLAGAAIVAAQDATECRESTFTTADGRQTTMRYCRDAGGDWRRVGGAELPPPPLPYRAEMTYRGSYSATSTKPGRPVRRLDLKSLLAAQGESTPLEGAMTIVLTTDGIAAHARIIPTGGLSATSLSGLAQNGRCRLADAANMIVYEGSCGRQRFVGTISSTANALARLSGRFDLRAESLRDLSGNED